jgi:exodeoxyribonuclease VII small subunit
MTRAKGTTAGGSRRAARAEAPAAATVDFEQAMKQLDDTVRMLEAGELPLEESLAAFEKGVALVRTLHSRLDNVQARIDELTQGEGGAALAPLAGFDDDIDEGDADDE